MEQRRLRLGDILDDYCPRERRVTNHAVVAMIEENVKQTRCATCDSEHAYKGGRAPRRRKKDATAELYQEVLAGMPEADAPRAMPVAPVAPVDDDLPRATDVPVASALQPQTDDLYDEAAAAPPVADEEPAADEQRAEEEPAGPNEDGPIHRRLIRATLPRPEGQKVERAATDFTMHSNANFRGDRSRMRGHGGNPNANGHAGQPGRRFAGGGGQGRGAGRPGFSGPSTGSGRGPSGPGRGPGNAHGRGPSTGSGRGPATGSGRPRRRPR